MKPWIEKYRPRSADEIIGNDKQIKKLQNYISNYSSLKKRAVLVYGPAGSGKTSAVHAIARDMSMEILEVNASDFRNRDQINLIVGNALKQRPLFGKGKIILVDEVDGIAGHEDMGGVQALIALMKKSKYPVVLTANDVYSKNLSTVRKQAELIEFKALNTYQVAKVFRKILEKENVRCEDELLKLLARKSAGDLRAGINDLQVLSQGGEINEQEIEDIDIREKEESITNSLLRVLKTTQAETALGAFDNVKEDMDSIFMWVDQNMPKEYDDVVDLERAYDVLSRADVLRGRIRRWQHWRFMAYIYEMLSAGIALAKKEKYKKFVLYRPSSRIFSLWISKSRREKLRTIAEKVGIKTHCSTSKAMNETIPYLRIIFKKNKRFAAGLASYFNFEEDEIKVLS